MNTLFPEADHWFHHYSFLLTHHQHLGRSLTTDSSMYQKLKREATEKWLRTKMICASWSFLSWPQRVSLLKIEAKKPASVRLKDFNCFPEFEKLLNYHLMFLQRGIKTKKVKHGAPKLKQKTVASSFILIPRETFFFLNCTTKKALVLFKQLMLSRTLRGGKGEING